MSSYIPPHARRAKEAPRSRREYVSEQTARVQQEAREKRIAQEKKLEKTEENYPTLVTQTRASGWGADKKTFAQLATEWSEKATEEKLQEEKKKEEEQQAEVRPRYIHSLPKFHNVHRFVEPEDEYSEEELSPIPKEDDGWVTVQRKTRREKTIEEKFNRPDTPPENTAWDGDDQPKEHETCWDDKRY